MEFERANAGDSEQVAAMVGELLSEIMETVGSRVFEFDLQQTTARLEDAQARGRYVVFVARASAAQAAGFVALYESFALYAGGVFGTIAEFYVRPQFRSEGVGRQLMSRAKSFGKSCGWTRLEVTSPPVPAFDRTVAFYEREGFAVTGGRKLKTAL
jgi:GNAT superfamily N-acetyltransferase